MAGGTRLWTSLVLAAGLAQACQPETVIEACSYRGYATYSETIVRACDARLATGGLTTQQLAAIHYQRGLQYSGLRQYDRAIADLSQVIRLVADSVDAYSVRAQVHVNAGNLDNAVADYDQVIRLKPDSDSYTARARVLSAKGAYARAIADLDEVIRRGPPEGWLFVARADAWAGAGRFDRAIADYDEAVRHGVSRTVRCWPYAVTGRLDEALALCNEALAKFPWGSQEYLRTARGIIHLKAHRLDDAITDFDAALDREPHLARALYGRGMARQRKGQRDEAKADIAAAVAIQPDIAREMSRYGVRP